MVCARGGGRAVAVSIPSRGSFFCQQSMCAANQTTTGGEGSMHSFARQTLSAAGETSWFGCDGQRAWAMTRGDWCNGR